MMISTKELCAGNVKKEKLTDIWYNSKVFQILRKSSIKNVKGECRKCIFKQKCMGGCRSCAFQLKKDINDDDPRCPLVTKEVDINGEKI